MPIPDLLSNIATYGGTAGIIALAIDRWVHKQDTNTERLGVRIDALVVQIKTYCDRIDDVERELEKIEHMLNRHREEASKRAADQQAKVGEVCLKLVALEEANRSRDRERDRQDRDYSRPERPRR